MKSIVKVFLTSIILLFIFTRCGNNPFENYYQLTENIKQYKKSEFQIILNEKFNNPYDARDVALNMILKSPSGDSLFLPCYFEKDCSDRSLWKARFSPREVGEYSYYFQLVKNNEIITRSESSTFVSLASDGDGFLNIYDFWTLRFDSGKPFRGIGKNVGWESRSFDNPKWTYDYLLPTLSNNGANFFRVWMAPNNFPLEWKTVVNTIRYTNTDEYFNPGGIKRMDEVLELIDSLGLYMMVAFDSHNTLMEGRQWDVHNYNVVNGGPAATPEEFFTLKESREKYKNRLRYIVARWGYSVNIGAWEFFNEIDNAAFARTPEEEIIISHKAITDWHKEMAAYLKSIDPYDHVVTTSVSHREIEGLYALDELDLNQMHIYRRTKQIPELTLRYVEEYKKPFCWGEFGREWDWNLDFHEIADEKDHHYKIGLWYGIFSPTPILPMTWWWEWFHERGMTSYFNSVSEINDKMLQAGEGSFIQLNINADNIEAYAVKCGNTYFAYLLNDTTGNIVKTNVSIEAIDDDSLEFFLRGFLPDERKYVELGTVVISNGKIPIVDIILDYQKDIVLIIEPTD